MGRAISVGIDLGTTNSALAVCVEDSGSPEILRILQSSGPNRTENDVLLPSFCYLALDAEKHSGTFALPWDAAPQAVCGMYAKTRAAEVPGRTVTSAKSWLCNAHVDRRERILPWKSEESGKMSPLECSSFYLSHLKRACEAVRSRIFEETEVIITVPASFDEVARGLTHEAAELAGLPRAVLVEEPLAAFYAWISRNKAGWRDEIKAGDLVLVCDVGGGTSDFSFISVGEEGGDLRLDRISVGEHILLGGDNMDLALAMRLRQNLEGGGKKLDRWQFLSLVQGVRRAKEVLFQDSSLEIEKISIVGRGSSLFASALSLELDRSLLEEVLLDGFCPRVGVKERPADRAKVGLQELGLPYAADAAITRHLAHFLVKSLETVKASSALSAAVGSLVSHVEAGFLIPSKILFNGGVFKAEPIRKRILELLGEWTGRAVLELSGAEHDLAVAKGAAAYGLIRRTGKGLRISTKTLRSYYLGIESSAPAVPGYEPPLLGLCVVPQGLEEGTLVELPAKQFRLTTGQPVEFRFFSSDLRPTDAPGTIVEDAEGELQESSSLSITIPALESGQETVPVRLTAHVNEMGILELWMHHLQTERRWKLEFRVRAED